MRVGSVCGASSGVGGRRGGWAASRLFFSTHNVNSRCRSKTNDDTRQPVFFGEANGLIDKPVGACCFNTEIDRETRNVGRLYKWRFHTKGVSDVFRYRVLDLGDDRTNDRGGNWVWQSMIDLIGDLVSRVVAACRN